MANKRRKMEEIDRYLDLVAKSRVKTMADIRTLSLLVAIGEDKKKGKGVRPAQYSDPFLEGQVCLFKHLGVTVSARQRQRALAMLEKGGWLDETGD